ncbi:MAG: 50S ribosome-binding GTPase [Theionarchaea archaeon]|nr:50S ribosome-binding GTPase [Theionarchaea archaeon]MBU7000710.1 50S ribosome-binding GTPase [Theionarchaea archaeon]MBU7021507.1 50S ribosome-binding GTPase [Theionarchaea archaeon]MBU7033553.1 50S ribosome-binding GTPase [Theionarchaea archaeon]MBU7039638.1 50S ribosome-binding GTPase [Theionarchaea archaeon]
MFKEIPPFTKQEIVDVAFRKASKKGRNDLEKVTMAADTIASMLEKIIKRYPSFQQLDTFQRELIDIIVGEDSVRHNLGALQWALNTIQRIKREYLSRMRKNKELRLQLMQQCYARYVSVLDQVEENLTFLRDVRKKLISLPSVNPDLYTVVLAGLPNVGKTSILRELTGSEPDIQPYPFTTQGINIGHMEYHLASIQVVDTPGLLDRPLSQRNWIERQAISALTNVADLIVYIFDVSETCGYSIDQQARLLEEIRDMGVPLIVINNKCDLGESGYFNISAETHKGIGELREEIEQHFVTHNRKAELTE